MKVCVKCLRPEGEVAFQVEKTRNGELRPRRDCKECRKAYLKGYYASRPSYFSAYRETHREKYAKQTVDCNRRARHERYDLIAQMKSEPCLDCKRAYPPYVMDFDHRDPATKIAGVSTLVKNGTPWAQVLAEIAKCDLVCRNCHALRTYKGDRNYRTRLFRENRARLDDLKSGTPCLDCKGFFKPCQMEFDHVRGEKVLTVSQMVHLPWEAIEAEIAKCELTCANCHRERTQGRHPGRATLVRQRVRRTTLQEMKT